jgi:hypothetical protein
VSHLVEAIHSASGRWPSDDAFDWHLQDQTLHAWVIDGATSVSERPDKVRAGVSDASWFANALSRAIRRRVVYAPLTQARLADILADLLPRFEAMAGGALDAYDYPVAAMTYVSVTRRRDRFVLQGLQFADCFLHLQTLPKPQQGQNALHGALPARPLNASLPKTPEILAHLRARRSDQVLRDASSAVTIFPRSAAQGTPFRFTRPGHLPIALLLGSDGIARLWEEYNLCTIHQSADRILRHGALGELVKLRHWEATHSGHGMSIKPADDATLLYIQLDSHAFAKPHSAAVRQFQGTAHFVYTK